MASSLWTRQEDRLHLHLHPGQAKAWKSNARFLALLAGTQGGKTSFLPFLLFREIERNGAGDYLAVTASYDLLKLKFLPSLRECFEHILKRGRYWSGDKIIEIADPEGRFWANTASDPMWGRVILRSAASGGGLESATAKAAILDEAGQDSFTVEDWEAVLRRLSLSQGRAIIGTTPYNVGWLKTLFYDRWAGGDPDYEVVQFRSIENPAFPVAEYERAKATMPGWRFQLMYEGLFSRPAGMIYDCFSDDLHLCDDIALPAHWPHYLGVDFGGANTAILWAVEEPGTDRLFVFEETLTGGKSTPDHAADVLEKAKGKNLVAAWGGAPGETQQRWDWQAASIPILQPPVGDVESGIDRVTQLFKEKRIKICRSLKGLRDEIGSYRRKLDKQGQPTEDIEDKRAYHRLDALRYLAAGLVNAPSYHQAGAVGMTRRRD